MKIPDLNSIIRQVNINKDYDKAIRLELDLKVLEVFQEEGLVKLSKAGKELIMETDIDLSDHLGESLDLIITEGKIVEIKEENSSLQSPIKNKLLESSKEPTNKLQEKPSLEEAFPLKSYNLKNKDLSNKVFERFLEFELNLNEQDLNSTIRVMDKISDILNLQKEEEVILLDNMKFSNNSQEINRDINEDFILDIDIDKLIIRQKPLEENVTSYRAEKGNGDLTLNLDGQKLREVFSESLEIISEDDILDIVVFLKKNNMKVNLRNIKYMVDLREDPISFSKEFTLLKFLDRLEDPQVNKEGGLGIDLKSIDLKKLEKGLSIEYKESLIKSSPRKDLEVLESKLEFIKNLNENIYYLHMPIRDIKRNLDGVLEFAKKKTSSLGKKDYLDIYISLNTENMSQVSIYLQQYGDKIDLNFKLNEEHIDYFKSKESDLVRLLKAYPFKIGKIGYLEEAPKKVIGLDKKVKTRYFLDVEV